MDTTNRIARKYPVRPGGLLVCAALVLALIAWVPAASAVDWHGHGKHGFIGDRHGHSVNLPQQANSPVATSQSLTCGDVLSAPGRYTLDADVTCSKEIWITASHVTLDLQGHSITCDPNGWQYRPEAGDTTNDPDKNVWIVGVDVNYHQYANRDQEPLVSDVHVTNGTVTNCGEGVLMYKANGSEVSNMNLTGNKLPSDCCWARGLELDSSNHNRIYGNHLNDDQDGLGIFNSEGNQVADNEAKQNVADDGIYLLNSTVTRVSDNHVSGNDNGIEIDGFGPASAGNRLTGNSVGQNAGTGVVLVGTATNNLIRENEVHGNANGIALLGIPDVGLPVPAYNIVLDNTATGNAALDLGEVNLLDFFSSPYLVANDSCSNVWKNNTFETALGAPGCIE